MVAFQTDMSLPKDIDTIRIVVSKTGLVLYDQSFEKLGSEESIRLPATLGFEAPEEAGQPLTIRVMGGRLGTSSVSVLREVVTTVPADRTARLAIPIQFLCDGSAEVGADAIGNPLNANNTSTIKSTCPDGKTCIAGSCAPSEVDSSTLPDFDPEDVFGGGTGTEGDGQCFDTASCFEGGADTAVDLEAFAVNGTCRAMAGGAINVALRTQGAGICGTTACYVALDAESDSGWKASGDGSISLPPAVCDQLAAGTLVGVTTAPVGTLTCQQKREGLPTCGPWGASGSESYTPPPVNQPVLIASAQRNPIAIGLSDSDVYWTSGSTFTDIGAPVGDGGVKTVPLLGGQPRLITTTSSVPRDLVVDQANQFVAWTDAAAGKLMWAQLGVGEEKLLSDMRMQPEGITRRDVKMSGSEVVFPYVCWTELGTGAVFQASLSNAGTQDSPVLVAENPQMLPPLDPPGTSPRRIAAASNAVCWTYEGKLGATTGSVACAIGDTTVPVATGEPTPRAIVLEVNADGDATAVIWARFAESANGGALVRATLNGATVGAPQEIVPSNYPNGIVLEGTNLFWTSRSDGTVMMTSLADAAAEPAELVAGQNKPGALAVNATHVFWLNEGSNESDGAVMKVAR
jgi:hypothetical protein